MTRRPPTPESPVREPTRHQWTSGPAWVLHGLASPHGTTIEHAELGCDEELVGFLRDRLREGLDAARRRTVDRGIETGIESGIEGADLTRRILDELGRGALPDDVTLHLLLTAFAGHPDFRERWADPRTLLDQPPTSCPTPTPANQERP